MNVINAIKQQLHLPRPYLNSMEFLIKLNWIIFPFDSVFLRKKEIVLKENLAFLMVFLI